MRKFKQNFIGNCTSREECKFGIAHTGSSYADIFDFFLKVIHIITFAIFATKDYFLGSRLDKHS